MKHLVVFSSSGPIFATVLAILITAAGILAMPVLPISE